MSRIRFNFSRRLAASLVLSVCALFVTAAPAFAGFGFFKQFVIIDGGSGNTYYGNNMWNNFHTKNLTLGATWYKGDSRYLNGAEANTFENGGDWVNNARLFYKINTTAGGGGDFTQMNLDQRSPGSGDRMFDQTAQNIHLARRDPGTYGIEVYFEAQANNGGWNAKFYDSATPNYRATYIVTALNSPSGQSATAASSTQINLGWTRGNSGGLKNTVIFRSSSSTAPTLADGTAYAVGATVGSATCVYNDSGTSSNNTELTAGTQYYYHFFAVNNDYYSAAVTANATTHAAPAAPSITSITPGNGQLSVAFSAGADGGSTITTFEYSTDDGSTWRTRASGTTASPLVITALSTNGTTALANGTTYTVRIRAVNNVGPGSQSGSSTSTPQTTPSVTTGAASSITTTAATLAGNITSTGGASVIERGIYWSTSNNFADGTGTKVSSTGTFSTGGFTVNVSGLTQSTTYYFKAFAVNAAGTVYGSQGTFITAAPAAATLDAAALASSLSNVYGAPSSGVSFTASGANLTSNIAVAAQSGFEVSTSQNSGFGSSVSVASGTTVWIRTASTRAAGTFNSATVAVLSGAGAASDANVVSSESGNEVTRLSLTGTFTASNKEYNGSNTATVATRAVTGKVGSDEVNHTGGTATFDNANAGTNKTVTLTGATLTGAAANNYTLGSVSATTANVTTKALTGTFTASSKEYDGVNTATVATCAVTGKVGSDDVNHTGGSATFDNANVGTGKTVTLTGATLSGAAAGNYSLSSVATTTADITAKSLTISGVATTSRLYDGTTIVAVSGGSLVGVGTGDVGTLGGSPTGTVATSTVGTGKLVTVTGYTISGASAGNYTLTQPTGLAVTISKATPTITTAPTASAIFFGQALSASTLSGGAGSVAGTFAWTSSSTVHAVGTTSYPVTFTPTDTTNYNTATTNVTLTTSMPQAKNSGTAGAPQAPGTLYLGDDGTFGLDSWGAIASNWGRARLWVRYNNSDISGGTSTDYTDYLNQNNKTRTSPRFSQTGTWYWGFQMDYSSPYGSTYWYKSSLSDWASMATDGTGATLSVTVSALNNPSGATATAEGDSSVTLNWTRGTSGEAKDTIIVRRQGSAVATDPTPGQTYNANDSVGGGVVVYRGSATTFTDSGLSAGTTYHYKLYAENFSYYSDGLTASATTAAPTPTISTTGTPTVRSANYGTASTATTFSVSGANMSAGINAAAPAGFEVSLSSGSDYADSISVGSSGAISSTPVYVRLKANAAPGERSGNVVLTSSDASTVNVAVSGTVSVPSMSMTVNTASNGTLNADYTTSKLFVDEVAGEFHPVTISFSTGVSAATEVEVWTNLNNRDLASGDANADGIPDGIIPPDPPTDKPEGYASGAYPSSGYFQAHPMSGSGGTYTLTLNASKTGAYRLTARYRVNGGEWVWYNYGGKRDHAITVTPKVARQMQVYEINVLNVNATSASFEGRSTFESLTDTDNGRVNLQSLRNLGVNTLWFQPIHPNGIEGREQFGGSAYEPGSPYAVKNFFEVMEQMSQGNSRSASMTAFQNFTQQADAAGVHVMLDAPFNHTSYDCEISDVGLPLFQAAGLDTSGWNVTDKIKDREARFYSGNSGSNAYAIPATSAANVAVAPDRSDFGKWNDVIDVYFGRYAALVTGNPDAAASVAAARNEADTINYDDLRGGAASAGAVTRAVWQYFAQYVPHWLEKTGLPAGASIEQQTYVGVDGLRADFGQGMPPQFWEYAINVARAHKWSFVFMAEALDGGEVTYRSNRHFDVLNENIVPDWQNATTTTTHRAIFEGRRAAYGQGLVLLNNTSHDEVPYADPWQAFIRYAVGNAMDGAPMIMYGQEIGTGQKAFDNVPQGSFDFYELNFGKFIPHFKRYNSMQPQWTAWQNNSLGVRNLMPAYSGVGLAREFSPALRSSNRWFLNPINTINADERIFAVAKYETTGGSPSTSDVVLAFVNLDRGANPSNTFGIPAGLGTVLGLESNKLYNIRNIAAYLGPNNEYPNRRSEFLWNTPRSGADILENGIYVALNGVPATDQGWATNPHEAQYLKVYAAPSISTSGTLEALTGAYGSPSTTTSFTVSATDVHDGITITAPNGFEISDNASSGFVDQLFLDVSGTVSSTTIYVRLRGDNAVGSYSGNITLSSAGGGSTTVATASSTVGQVTPTITTNPTASAIIYGQALSASSLTGGAASVGGNFAFTTPATTPNAGTANQSVTFTPTDTASYNTVTFNVSVTVNKATPTVTTAPTASAISFGQTLASSTLSGGTASTAGSFAFTDATIAPAAGTANQSVTFTPTDTANFNTATVSVSVTVNSGALPTVIFTEPEGLVYDGTAKTYGASASGPSTLTLTYTGRNGTSYNSTTAPTNAGDYTVTATTIDPNYSGSQAVNFSITARELTITGVSAAGRIYDGTTAATLQGAASYSGLVQGQSFSVTGSPEATFQDAAVGDGKTVTVTGFTAPNANYSVTQPVLSADITPKVVSVTGLTGANKVYDGTATASVNGTAALDGVLEGDAAGVSLGGTASFSFANASVGNGQAITVTGYSISGAKSGNYSLSQPTGLTANITAKSVTVTGLTGVTKEYDGTTTASVTGTPALHGVLAGDTSDVTLGGTASYAFASATAANGRAITASGFSLSGSKSGNYSLSQPSGLSANITRKALSISAPALAPRAFDGTATPGDLTVGTLSGLVGSETLTVSGSAASYPSASAGSYEGIVITYTLGNGTNGGLSANYTLASGTATGIVTPSSVASGDITLTRDGDSWSASAEGVSGFTISYSGRSANGITTVYGPSTTVPTAAGFYTVTATSSDENFSGTGSTNYAVTGPVAVDDAVLRPTGNAAFEIPLATLLTNDKRITDANGTIATNNLSITAVSSGAGSPTVTISVEFVTFTAGGNSAETFTYTLTDSVTGKTATGTVTVTPEAEVEPLRLLGHTIGTPVYNGRRTSVTMTFTGAPNTTYYLYYKGELNHAEWKSVGGLYSETGVFQVTIQENGDHAADWSNSMFFDVRR